MIGLIGLGNVGAAVARRLLAAGCELRVFDTDAARVECTREAGAKVARSPRELGAQVDLAITALPSAAATEDAVLDPERGVVSGLRAGATLIDFSTNSMALTRRVGTRCAEREIHVIDAPMTQARGTVEEGRAVILVGGDPTVIARWRPVLSLFSEQILEMGPHGNGTATKLVIQYIGLANIVTALEGGLLAAAAGLDLQRLHAAIQLSPGQSIASEFARDIIETRPFEQPGSADGTFGLLVKDIEQVLELAADLGVSHRMGIGLHAAFTAGDAAACSGENFTAILRVLEDLSGGRITVSA